MGSSSTPSKTTQTTEPPKFIQPYMQYGAEQARGLYEQGPQQYYPGQTVVPFSPQTERAMQLTEQRALNGSPVTDAAQRFATSTLSSPVRSSFGSSSNPYTSSANPYARGENMFGGASNPMLDRMFDQAALKTRSALDTQFAGAGRNLEAQEDVRADQLKGLATDIYGGAYENERNRQLQYQQQLTGIGANSWDAAQARGFQGHENERSRMLSDLQSQGQQRLALTGMTPQLAAQDYADINALQGVGAQVEDLSGRYMEDNAARWDYSQNAAQQNLDSYLQRINGAYPGGSSTSSTPVHRNRAAGAVGGAMTGAAFGPWGALIGGGLGALL